MWREMIIFADTQSSKQAEISITEAHSNPLWSVDSRGAGQFAVHKVILSASSIFFRDILKGNKHPHPLIYIRGGA